MASIKFLANQAKSINIYKNLRAKVMKRYDNIYFNRQCLIKKVTPKYANIRIPPTFPAANITRKKMR